MNNQFISPKSELCTGASMLRVAGIQEEASVELAFISADENGLVKGCLTIDTTELRKFMI